MRATEIHAPLDIRLAEVPDPRVEAPTDALVRVVASCICGSDLWPYRAANEVTPGSRIGHEFVGVVTDTGTDVASVRVGDFVVAPFVFSDGTCDHCRNGVQTSCRDGGFWGSGSDGAQGELVRVPQADGTLVATPQPGG